MSGKGKMVSRRQFMQGLALAGGGAILAACQPSVVTEEVIVRETVVVEREGETVVEERIVTATPPPAEPVSVHYTTDGGVELIDEYLIPLVEERTEGITLTADVNPWGTGGWDTYADNVITRIAGGEGIDIIYIAIEGLALLTEKKIIMPFDPFLEVDVPFREDVEEDIHPTLMRGLNWKGQQMMIPTAWNNMVIHYNHTIFEEKGVSEPTEDWTWDDFLDASLTIADVNDTADDLFAFSFWDSQFGMTPWYFNNDTSAFKNDWTDSNMDDPKVAETLQFLADLILKHKVTPNPAGWDEDGQFFSRHLAMRACGAWCIPGCNNNEFYDYKLQYYPHNAGPLKTVVGLGGDGIATMTQHPEAAWEVVKLINSPEYLRAYGTHWQPLLARRSLVEGPEFLDLALPAPADLSLYYASLDYADFVPSPPNFNVIDPVLQRWYSQIWNGQISVEEAVVGAHAELQAEMDKLKA
ncbi:MAG: extracellular solute-binding protein [Chloroflexi bacterium]|nr:extracellular solute-binding protein [Chloroflexota bacterium]